jgi:hypothetical protein
MTNKEFVNFFVRVQNLQSEMSEMLKTGHDDTTVSKSKVSRWRKHSREDVKDDERQSIPVTKQMDENVAKIRELMQYEYDRHRNLTLYVNFVGQLQEHFLNHVITGDEVLLSLLSRGQRSVHGVEIEEFPETKETTDVKVQDQNNADLILASEVSCTFNLYLKVPLLITHFNAEELKRLMLP